MRFLLLAILVVGILIAFLASNWLLKEAIVWVTRGQEVKPPGLPEIERKRAFDYSSILDSMDPVQFRKDIQALTSLESRVSGYEGSTAAGILIDERLREIGLSQVGTSSFPVAVPLDNGAILTVGDQHIPLYALWPNSSRTSTLQAGGVDGPIFYAKTGELHHFDGNETNNSIVLMDFNCGMEWMNAFMLNAAAVILIEPEIALAGEAQSKVVGIPMNTPRFWIKREDAQKVIPLLVEGQVSDCHLMGRMDWGERQCSNVFGIIPGTDPDLCHEYMVLQAYYDSMSVVPQLAPGTDQSGGIVTLLQLARVLKDNPPARSVVFLATSGHFQALQGMREAIYDDTIYRAAGLVNEGAAKLYDLRKEKRRWRQERIRLLGEEASSSQKAQLAETQREFRRVCEELDELERGVSAPRAVFSLDLSGGNDQVGVFFIGDMFEQGDTSGVLKRDFSRLSARLRDYSRDMVKEYPELEGKFLDGIDPFGATTAAELLAGSTALDSEPAIYGGMRAITLLTAYDARALAGTPKDSFENRGQEVVSNVYQQAKLVAGLVANALNDPELPAVKPLDDYYRVLVGSVKEFDPASGFLPKDPVPGSVVFLEVSKQDLKGVRGQISAIADARGEFEIRGIPSDKANAVLGRKYPLQAYAVDPVSGDVVYAPDMGDAGSSAIDVVMDAEDKNIRIIAFPCKAVDLFDLVDHRTFRAFTSLGVLDSRTDALPSEYGFSIPTVSTAATEDHQALVSRARFPVATLFVDSDSRFKVLLGDSALLGWSSVLLNMQKEGEDKTFSVEEIMKSGTAGQKESGYGYEPPVNGRLANTTVRASQDMFILNDFRLKRLAAGGVTNSMIENLQYELAVRELKKAQESAEQGRHSKRIASSRTALGLEARAYPGVMGTANDVVKGIVFYLFLLLPFSFFIERLVFGFADINRRIMGFFGVFAVTFMLIAVVHPAFGLKKTLVVIPLGFVILALSLLVMFIVGGRFEEEIKKLRKSARVEHREDVGRVSAATASFALGVSNMRRRKMRTILTSVTLILFMFTVMSFTSVQSSLKFNRIHLDEETPYRGLLLRNLSWTNLESFAFSELENEYRDRATVKPRYWMGSTAPAVNKAEFRLRLQNPASPQLQRTVLTAAGLSVAEKDTYLLDPDGDGKRKLGDMLLAGRWFGPSDKLACILPQYIAQRLGINEEDVDQTDDKKPRILMSSLDLLVCGILDDKVFELHDLDGEEFAPLDPRANKSAAGAGETLSSAVSADASGEFKPQKGVHIGANETIVLPYRTAENLGGKLYSVAMVFGDSSEFGPDAVKDLMSRAEVNVFAGVEEEEGETPQRWLYSSVGLASLSGAENLLVPILIAVGIVLNTMLGSVFERVREIGIYSSVGLAPSHIGVLFIAESLVYAVVGGVAGYLLGQLVNGIVSYTGILQGLTLNYSSLSAVFSSFIVMGVVVLSALYPAIKASRMAVPDVHRRWQPEWPEGDLWEFDLPFTVGRSEALGQLVFLKEYFDAHEEGSVGVFSCAGTNLKPLADDVSGASAELEMNVWLAPFDFGVTQEIVLQSVRAELEEVHNVLRFKIKRTSGDVSNWRRANIRFVNEIRKQCLIWRIVSPDQKDEYQETGQKLLKLKGATTV